MLPSDFFRRGVVLSFQEDAIGIRLRDVIGVDNMMWDNNMMWGSEYPHSESTFPQSRKILAEILEGVLDDEQAKPARDSDPGIAGGNTTRAPRLEEPTSADRRARRPRAVHRGRASTRFCPRAGRAGGHARRRWPRDRPQEAPEVPGSRRVPAGLASIGAISGVGSTPTRAATLRRVARGASQNRRCVKCLRYAN
jgi:hypothetical protein